MTEVLLHLQLELSRYLEHESGDAWGCNACQCMGLDNVHFQRGPWSISTVARMFKSGEPVQQYKSHGKQPMLRRRIWIRPEQLAHGKQSSAQHLLCASGCVT